VQWANTKNPQGEWQLLQNFMRSDRATVRATAKLRSSKLSGPEVKQNVPLGIAPSTEFQLE